MNTAATVAPQVWQEFSPRDSEKLAVRDDDISDVLDGAAAWTCPWTKGLARYMNVTPAT